MKKIAQSLTELIGNTPMLELSNYNKYYSLGGKVIAKLEYFNPGGSVKDRIGYDLIIIPNPMYGVWGSSLNQNISTVK